MSARRLLRCTVAAVFVASTTGCGLGDAIEKARGRDRPEVAEPPVVAAPTATAAPVATTVGLAPTETSPETSPETTAVATTVPPPVAKPALDTVSVALTEIGTFSRPTTLATRGADLYVGEQGGTVQRRSADGTVTLALDISADVTNSGEQGLLGIAFTADGTMAYVHFSDTNGDTAVDEFPVSPDGTFDVSQRRHVFGQEQPFGNHNGGQIEIGPDGMLYIGLGDGGSADDPGRRASRLDNLLGKILRIDPRASGDSPYGIPADNPFVGVGDARPEILHFGLRNPWRFSFDRSGAMWIGDVGQGELEEIDRADPGAIGLDFGWSAFEGSKRFNDDVDANLAAVLPFYEYPHGDEPLQGCSVTGGVVYESTAIAGLQGAYIFADYCQPGVRALDPTDPTTLVSLTTTGSNISGFTRTADGTVFLSSLSDVGPVYRLDPAQ